MREKGFERENVKRRDEIFWWGAKLSNGAPGRKKISHVKIVVQSREKRRKHLKIDVK